MTEIVTLAQFKEYVRDEANGVNDSLLQSYLTASIQGFGFLTQRVMVLVDVSSTASDWLLAADPCSSVLAIPDCATLVSITENGALVAATSYQAEPVNQRHPYTMEYRPYDSVRRLRSYWYSDYGRAAITANGKWGSTSFPNYVVEAIKVLGKEICNNQDVRLGIVALSDAAISGARTNSVVKAAVANYRRVESFGLA